MKTPEQMAEEYGTGIDLCCGTSDIIIAAEKGFLAGYQAAKDQLADADKVMFCVYCNDTHKGNCAIGKGKNHPAFGFSEIVVKIESGWVSVKDRLPPPQTEVLWWNKTAHQAGVSSWEYMPHCNDTMIYWGDAGNVSIKNFTHWMPLPKPSEE
ncbi:Domain of unknown function DUF551 [uncultured Caudovirales phage]|uniref:DUF551 domain-containing protein n=1 Tax=uncultured Caudovirales phage TaxID=2100421 RepID=A0A6J5P2R5_9CAUD|nr:Domain of unknown function DUF551 [uncultured Caudovirales phage]